MTTAIEPTSEELEVYDSISALTDELWGISKEIEGLNTDPKMFSIMLFQRLRSNHRGFTILWKNEQYLEADIVLRSGVETAICLVALREMKDDFIILLKKDAAFTILGQIKSSRDADEMELVKDGEATLRMLQSTLPTGEKPSKLDWKMLADTGGFPQLYGYHRHLSGVSSHVTGLSILKRVADADGTDDQQQKLRSLEKKMHLMMMAGATLQGSLVHAGMIDHLPSADTALSLTHKLAHLSNLWPGVLHADHPETGA